jgi:endonuclease/exonuclease/phosphatase family metal-dependent hydrolase
MKIKLGTFNLFQFVAPPYSWYTKKDKFNTRQWFEKTTWIKNQIRTMDCDIIGFQEVFSKDALKTLVKELNFDYFITVDVAKLSSNNPYKYVTTTVALASKYPIAKIEEVSKDKDFFDFARNPIKATITLPNEQVLLVYVCHLKSNRLNEFEYIFHEEDSLAHKQALVSKALEGTPAKALRQRLYEASALFFDIKSSKETATVLLCDLNDKEFSLTIDTLANPKCHDDTSKEDLLLYDAYYQHKPILYNPHPEQKEPKRKATSYFLGKGNVLDYIFISKALKVIDYTVLDTHLEENKNGSLLTSDHAQVVCELELTLSICKK